LERIEESAFSGSGLKSVLIPSSAVILGEESFHGCRSLESVACESGSRLERIEERAFCGSGLKSVLIPSSVVVLGERSFSQCESLQPVTFESGSRLEQIDKSMFQDSRVSFGLVSEELELLQLKSGISFRGIGEARVSAEHNEVMSTPHGGILNRTSTPRSQALLYGPPSSPKVFFSCLWGRRLGPS
jgi:hypothetical protein